MSIYNRTHTPPGYYIYIYLRETESKNGNAGTPYYIGKGSGNRAWERSGKSIKAPKNKDNIIIHVCNLTEEESFAEEQRLIKLYGRIDAGTGILRNKTNGGEGSSGHKRSGWKWSEESKAKRRGVGNPAYGKTTSDKQKQAARAQKGIKRSPETPLKLSKASTGRCLGRKIPQDVIERRTATLKENNKNRPKRTLTDEQKAHLRAINTGKKQKPESIAKMLATKATKQAQQNR